MNRLFATLAAAAMIMLTACGPEDPQSGNRPGDNNGNNSDNTETPGGGSDSGSDSGSGSGSGSGDVEITETIDTKTFTQGCMEFWGISYDDQPETSACWCITLAEKDFDLSEWEGTGLSIVIELFTTDTEATSLPLGNYTVEAFDKEYYSDYSVGTGFVQEDEETGDSYCYGTWIFEDGSGVYAAEDGSVKVSKAGDNFTVTYDFTDLQLGANFKGSYTGPLEFVDLTKTKTRAAFCGRRPVMGSRSGK